MPRFSKVGISSWESLSESVGMDRSRDVGFMLDTIRSRPAAVSEPVRVDKDPTVGMIPTHQQSPPCSLACGSLAKARALLARASLAHAASRDSPLGLLWRAN